MKKIEEYFVILQNIVYRDIRAYSFIEQTTRYFPR